MNIETGLKFELFSNPLQMIVLCVNADAHVGALGGASGCGSDGGPRGGRCGRPGGRTCPTPVEGTRGTGL